MKKTAFVIVIFALFAWAVFEAFSHTLLTLDWSQLQRFSVMTFLLFVTVSLINFSVFSWRWGRVIHAGLPKKVVSQWRLNMYRFVGYTVSYLTPFAQLGGEPLRIYFLEQHGIARREAVSSVLIDKLFEAGVQLIFVIIAITVVLVGGGNLPSEGLTLTLLGFLVFLVAIYLYMTIWGKGFFTQIFRWLRLHKLARIAPFEQKLMETEDIIRRFFRGHVQDLLWVCALSLLTYALFLGEYLVMLTSLGVTPTVKQLLVVAVLPMLAYLTPLPGAVGAFEVLSIAALEIVGLNGSLALPMIVMIRLRDLTFLIIGFIYASTHGIRLAQGGMQVVDENPQQ